MGATIDKSMMVLHGQTASFPSFPREKAIWPRETTLIDRIFTVYDRSLCAYCILPRNFELTRISWSLAYSIMFVVIRSGRGSSLAHQIPFLF